MSLARTLLVAGALAFVSPAIAQTTGSETCTTITQSAANAATSRVNADDTDIPKPQTVKNFTCLDKFFNGTGLNVVANLLNPTTLLNSIESQICNKLTQVWSQTIGKAQSLTQKPRRAKRLMANWIAARVTKAARVSARFS